MNHVYQVVWNQAKGVFEAVAENATSHCSHSSAIKTERKPRLVKKNALKRSALMLASLMSFAGYATAATTHITVSGTSLPLTVAPGDQVVVNNSVTAYVLGTTLNDGGIVLGHNISAAGTPTLVINTASTLNNAGYLSSSGTLAGETKIINHGTLTNIGTVGHGIVSHDVDNTGTLINIAGVTGSGFYANNFDNSGTVTTSGKMGVTRTLTNTGLFTNTGNLAFTGAFTSIDNLDNQDTFINGGTILSSGNITLVNQAGAELKTYGVIRSSSVTGGDKIVNRGEFTIQDMGEVDRYQVLNYGNATFKIEDHGTMTGGISLGESSTLINNGAIELTHFMAGTAIELTDNAKLINEHNAHIDLKAASTDLGKSYGHNISIKDSAQLENRGLILVDSGKGTANEYKAYIHVGSNAVLNNTETLNFTDSTKRSYLEVLGTLNNTKENPTDLTPGHINLGEGVHVRVGEHGNTMATVLNAGTIQGNNNTIEMRGNTQLISEAGSSLTGVKELRLYWDGDYTGSKPTVATLKFNGQSNFAPATIAFGWDSNFPGFGAAPVSSTLNIDVASGVTQTIASNIEVTTINPGLGSAEVHDGNVNKLGAGALILGGQSNYTKGTNVQAGALFVGDAAGSNAFITGPVAIRTGATLGGHGTVNGHVDVASGARLSAGLGSNNAGVLTITGNLNLNAGSQIDFDVSDAATDSFIVNGNLATNGATVNVNDIGDITTGLMRQIFQYGTASNTHLTLGATPQGTSASDFSITNNGNKIYINAATTVADNSTLKFWNPAATAQVMGSGGNGTWDATSATWTNQRGTLNPGVLDTAADFAVFSGAAGTVTVDGTVAAKGLQFLNNYTVTGGTVTLDSGAAGQTYISTGGNASVGYAVTIDSVIAGSHGINKLDAGTLILTGNNTYTGGTTVSGGTLQGNANSIQGLVNVKQNASLSFDQATNASFNNAISGAGQVIKTGAGTLTLAGTNSYTGGTAIGQGRLEGDTANIQGHVAINSGAGLTLNQGSAGTLAGVISGAGDFIKTGAGTLTLAGNNTYTGGTTVSQGTLQGSTSSLQGDINLSGANVELTFNQATQGVYAGSITSGINPTVVNKAGSGALTLNGSVTAGKINVQQGHLAVGDATHATAAVTGNVSVANGASVGGNGTISGTTTLQSGANLVAQAGETLRVDSLVLDGNNTLSIKGITSIGAANVTQTVLESGGAITGDFTTKNIAGFDGSADYITASVNKDVTNTKYDLQYGLSWFNSDPAKVTGNFTLANAADQFEVNLALTDASASVPAGNASGWDGNSLNKLGAGTLVLNSANTYTGLTDVQAGGLIVGGTAAQSSAQIAGDVDVKSGARLGGHGSILGHVNMQSGSTAAPGNSIGTLTVNDITFNPGSTLEFEANPDGTSDHLNVTGTATLNGGTVAVLASAGSWADQTTYTVISATNPLAGTGQFDSVTSNLAFLTPELTYDANKVSLSLNRNQVALQDVAATGNQKNTAWGISTLPTSSTIVSSITGMSALEARDAYDNLSGEIHGSVKSAMLTNSRHARNAVSQHLIDNAASSSSTPDANKALWVDLWGSTGHIKRDNDAEKLDNKSMGFLVGFDAYTQDSTTLGIALGYEKADLKAKNLRSSKADVDSMHVMAYGRTSAGPIDIRGGIGYAWLDVDSTRNITIPSLYATNKANYNGGVFQFFVEGSHTFNLNAQTSLTPYAGLAYSHIKTDSFAEKGGITTLHTGSSNSSITSTTLGVRNHWSINNKGSTIYADLGWQHNFGDVTPEAKLSFTDGSPYKINGVKIDRNSAIIGIGANLQIKPNMRLNAGYEGQFGREARSHGLKALWTLSF